MGTIVLVLTVLVIWRILTKVMDHREGNIIDGFLAVMFPFAVLIYIISIYAAT